MQSAIILNQLPLKRDFPVNITNLLNRKDNGYRLDR